MQFLKVVAVAVIYAQGALSMPANAAEDCGSLQVMNIDKGALPEDVNPDKLRKCLNHPEGRGYSQNEKNPFQRSCETQEIYGCSHGGYCWKRCGDDKAGMWCWVAENSGFGNWITCRSRQDCSLRMSCALDIPCDSCGCSC